MRVENNIKYSVKSSNNHKNNIQYYNLKSEADTVSFGANYNKPAKSILGKLSDILFAPINAIKKQIEKSKLEARLRKEAEEAARKAEQAAWEAQLLARMETEKRQAVESGKEIIANWKLHNKGKFEKRICSDDTGELIFCPEKMSVPEDCLAAPPKRGEYTLANIGVHEGYASKPRIGQRNWYFTTENHSSVTHLQPFTCPMEEWVDHLWRVRHVYTVSRIDKEYHACTVLSAGFFDNCVNSLGRQPGVNFLIEGHIPLEDMAQIKKNIVEKGLWKNYIEHQDEDAHLAIYNEIIDYLNRNI